MDCSWMYAIPELAQALNGGDSADGYVAADAGLGGRGAVAEEAIVQVHQWAPPQCDLGCKCGAAGEILTCSATD